MAHLLTADEKNTLGMQLTHAIGKAMIDGLLPSSEKQREVSDDVLTMIDNIQTDEDQKEAMEELTEKWPFFKDMSEKTEKQRDTIEQIQQSFQNRSQPS
jgi:hypothetical protein